MKSGKFLWLRKSRERDMACLGAGLAAGVTLLRWSERGEE